MMYFKDITSVDRITFEGREVTQTFPVTDRDTKRITHYNLLVSDDVGGAHARKFRVEEIDHLIEGELLVIDRGYHSIARQTDRSLYGDDETRTVGKNERVRIDRITYLARRMEHYHRVGMRLTIDGVHEFVAAIEEDYRNYQSLALYGTLKPNSTQNLKPLPAITTLLEYYRKFRRAGQDHRVFMRPKKRPTDLLMQEAEDLRFGVMPESW